VGKRPRLRSSKRKMLSDEREVEHLTWEGGVLETLGSMFPLAQLELCAADNRESVCTNFGEHAFDDVLTLSPAQSTPLAYYHPIQHGNGAQIVL
jgi:hypothetical protein